MERDKVSSGSRVFYREFGACFGPTRCRSACLSCNTGIHGYIPLHSGLRLAYLGIRRPVAWNIGRQGYIPLYTMYTICIQRCGLYTWCMVKDAIMIIRIALGRTLRKGMTNGRRGKFVASCSLAWNSSIDKCEFCKENGNCVKFFVIHFRSCF